MTKNQTSKHIPGYLLVALAVYCAASLIHFAHNAQFVSDYPNLPIWLTRSKVYFAWLAITAVGVVGVACVKLGFRRLGFFLIAGYALLGFAGLDHYTVAPISAHTFAMNATIWFEVCAAAVLLGVTAVFYDFVEFEVATTRKIDHSDKEEAAMTKANAFCRTIVVVLFALLIAFAASSSMSEENGNAAGISKARATEIANKFYENEIRIEGGITTPILRGEDWVFPLKMGAAGTIARDPLLVNRFSGKASWAGLEPAHK
jgi:hypothetical protein